MTRKDAIDRLDIIVSKHEVDDVYITLTNEKDYEALKVAINSLKIDERYELEYEQAEPKTGHWKPYLEEGLRYQCSACDSRFSTPWEYCPHCGAKIAESEDKE